MDALALALASLGERWIDFARAPEPFDGSAEIEMLMRHDESDAVATGAAFGAYPGGALIFDLKAVFPGFDVGAAEWTWTCHSSGSATQRDAEALGYNAAMVGGAGF